jgi:hypothetical protein
MFVEFALRRSTEAVHAIGGIYDGVIMGGLIAVSV